MDHGEVLGIEIDLLLEAIFRRYGYDFRHYARASIERRIRHGMERLKCETVSELIGRILHEPDTFQDLIDSFSITITEMFRDPEVYSLLRTKVIPYLATYPFIKVWHAGCASGEEVYSLAIVLLEEGILERTTIYATDFNEAELLKARDGIYPNARLTDYSRNYLTSGGRRTLADYYFAEYDSVIMAKFLRERITFARHNLASDQVFGEMHLIVCRNVMIYFDRTLQDRVLTLFDDSLIGNGFLCLGTKESLLFSTLAGKYRELDRHLKVYRKHLDPIGFVDGGRM
ncbi:MAG: protein-glutamate O-methyltransferase CheR [Proteobacteria bacterium]|nr:protein-glutamate O-methyltransferase CheR [Desulfobulbaceae bacterium]MBU4152105.1 protein-glutamate O-methyltransferase CheR [Pseudomonadota bacterium]